jgi:hypothetical protein
MGLALIIAPQMYMPSRRLPPIEILRFRLARLEPGRCL